MNRTQFTSGQIVFALRQVESGTAVTAGCRKMDIVKQIFYRWKSDNINTTDPPGLFGTEA